MRMTFTDINSHRLLRDRFFFIILLSVIVLVPLLSQSNEGTEFWFSFMQHRNPGQNTKVVMITSRVDTRGTISSPLQGFTRDFTVSANDVTIIELPPFAETMVSGMVVNNAMKVESDDLVSVYIHQYFRNRAEATIVLPVAAVDREYYSLSYQGYTDIFSDGFYPSQFLVVAHQDNTTIDITLSSDIQSGQREGSVLSITLDAGQTYQVFGAAPLGDLSGSYLRGDKPFYLFCGHRYTALNCNRSGRDNLLEQAIPISAWANKFVSAPFQEGIQDIYRILAAEDNTTVEVLYEDGDSESFTVMSGEFIEFEDSRASYIESNRPILIAQYMNQLDCANMRNGDPSMLYLNSVLQIRDTVTLYNSPFALIEENYINVISRSSDTSNVVFDGMPILDLVNDVKLMGPNREYASFTLRVNSGDHTISSSGCGVIAKAYGLGEYESYAYSGGASFNRLNASPIPDGGCLNDTVFFKTMLPPDRYNVRWVLAPGDTVLDHNFERIYNELGNYPTRLFIHDTCFDLFEELENDIEITQRESVVADPVGIFCIEDEIRLTSSDVARATYEWTGPEDYFSEDQNPVIESAELSDSGPYEVIGIVSGCATFPAIIDLVVMPNPEPNLGADSVFCPTAPLETLLEAGTYSSYIWDDGSTLSTLSVTEAGRYDVRVEDEFGCTGSDEILLTRQCPTQVYVPNAFTPNDDGANDEFGVFGEDIIAMRFSIFDRWGNEVFVTVDDEQMWDGNYLNDPASAGVYSWMLELTGYEENGDVFDRTSQGVVHLIR